MPSPIALSFDERKKSYSIGLDWTGLTENGDSGMYAALTDAYYSPSVPDASVSIELMVHTNRVTLKFVRSYLGILDTVETARAPGSRQESRLLLYRVYQPSFRADGSIT